MIILIIFTGYYLCSIIGASASTTTITTYDPKLRRTTRPASGCVLPPHPHNGKWSILGEIKHPGDIVPVTTILEFECNSEYKLTKNKQVICFEEWSQQEMPECKSSASTTTITTDDSKLRRTTRPASGCVLPPHPHNGKWSILGEIKHPGDIVPVTTILEFECNSEYKLTKNKQVICFEEWSQQEMPECEFLEQCGVKVNGSNSQNYDFDGELVKHIDQPWTVTIYRGRTFIGQGNILSRKLIITGARIVTVRNNWTTLNSDEISVATGKYFIFAHDPRDIDAVYYDAEKVYVFEGFREASNGLYGNIGFVVLKKLIQYDKWTQAICIQGVNDIVIKAGQILEIVGWSKWMNNVTTIMDTPRTDKVIIKKFSQCLKETPFNNFLSQDAICGGAVDNYTCIRHYGSGLVYKNPANDRYYLTAMFGFGLKGCERKNNLYTNIKYHYDYIIEQVKKYN